jgi:hypothetical protein
MWWFFVWVLLAVAVAVFAARRGRSAVLWFVLALLLSPVLGLLFLAVSRDLSARPAGDGELPTAQTHARCPACAEWVLPQAVRCRHCGAELTPDPQWEGRLRAQRVADRRLVRQQWALMAAVVGGAAVLVVAVLPPVVRFFSTF